MSRLLFFIVAVLSVSRALPTEDDGDTVTIVEPSTPVPEADGAGSRIIGGTIAQIGTFPFIVQVAQRNSQSCGGSLITRRHVLTAAHCFFRPNSNIRWPVSDFTVRSGTASRNRGGQVTRVQAVEIHSQYNHLTLQADIAIMFLRSRVTLNSRHTTTIPLIGRSLPDGVPLTYVGWGRTIEGSEASVSSTLRQVSVSKVNHGQCATLYRRHHNRIIPNDVICAGRLNFGGADACQGDSGGPLVFWGANGPVVAGVVSSGTGCGRADAPGLNVRVLDYNSWIVATTSGSGVPTLSGAVVILASLLVSLTIIKEV